MRKETQPAGSTYWTNIAGSLTCLLSLHIEMNTKIFEHSAFSVSLSPHPSIPSRSPVIYIFGSLQSSLSSPVCYIFQSFRLFHISTYFQVIYLFIEDFFFSCQEQKILCSIFHAFFYVSKHHRGKNGQRNNKDTQILYNRICEQQQQKKSRTIFCLYRLAFFARICFSACRQTFGASMHVPWIRKIRCNNNNSSSLLRLQL